MLPLHHAIAGRWKCSHRLDKCLSVDSDVMMYVRFTDCFERAHPASYETADWWFGARHVSLSCCTAPRHSNREWFSFRIIIPSRFDSTAQPHSRSLKNTRLFKPLFYSPGGVKKRDSALSQISCPILPPSHYINYIRRFDIKLLYKHSGFTVCSFGLG